ncbi:MAG: methylenetetrahydrofolate reductase [Clostridiales bacterium]|nr:methylenetetrahydrofolate reductase [Clostridiales bacterium]
MTIPQLIEQASRGRGFSFEVLPPLKGRGIARLFEEIDQLMPYGPLYINITTHRSEVVVKTDTDGLTRRYTERSRPGTVAVAAAIKNRYGIEAVPHIICSGYSRLETEYALIDLSFLDIRNLLVLRGDKAKHHNCFVPNADGHGHAIDLERQVNTFNSGFFTDGTEMDAPPVIPFDYGVAGYPEVHLEANDADSDLRSLKNKIDAGASYIVTQMFFDNEAYYRFVERCRDAGIDVPIVPGLKPIVNRRQMNILPAVFGVQLPVELVDALSMCDSDEEAKRVGVDWCYRQAVDLYRHGVNSIHFYSHNAMPSVLGIVKQLKESSMI